MKNQGVVLKVTRPAMIAIVTALVALLVGCASSSRVDSPDTPETVVPFSIAAIDNTVAPPIKENTPTPVPKPSTVVSAPSTQSADLVVAVAAAGPPIVDVIGYNGDGRRAMAENLGLKEGLFWGGFEGDPMSPMLAEAWSIDSRGEIVTLHLRPDVPWNAPRGHVLDLGTFNSEDVALWMNLTNANTNPESKDFRRNSLSAYGEARALDELRVEIDIVPGRSLEYGFLTGLTTWSLWNWSLEYVRGIETLGLEWVEANPVGTGPFEWGGCDEVGCTAYAVSDHWRKEPEVSSLSLACWGESHPRAHKRPC